MAGHEFTRAEIDQQPALWRQVAEDAEAGAADDAAFLQPLLDTPGLRVVLTGAGTSAFAGEVLAPLLRRRLGRRVDAVASTDIVAAPQEQFAESLPTLLVSFARSGDSPESVAATELADALLPSCRHLVVTCNPDGELAERHADRDDSAVLLMPDGSNDRGFAMTSSFSCMLLAVWLRLAGADAVDVARLSAAAEQVLSSFGPQAQTVARGLAEQPGGRIVYLGSGALHGLARESALKILELTAGRLVATAESSMGFRHGPKSVIDERTTVISYRSPDPYTSRYDADMAAELRAGAVADRVITIGPANAPTLRSTDDVLLPLGGPGEQVDEVSVALLDVVCAQLIALESALAVGTTPDNPFPSGTVNRVVQGVTVHPLEDGPDTEPAPGRESVTAHRSHRAVL